MRLIITKIILSYLIGSIPTAYIFGRLAKGIDVRKFGSGNVGATNAFRVLGKAWGITVLIIDTLKGFAAVVFLGESLTQMQLIILGLSCISGHNWPIFLGFKGGKGIAVTLGVLLGFSVKVPPLKAILGLAVLIWLAVLIITRIVSLASIVSAVALPVLMLVFKQSASLVFLSVILSILAVLRHKSNLKRILQGKEPRISFKKSRSY